MREIRTDLTIPAPPAAVWAVLTDFSSFAKWNSFIVSLEGEAAVNATLTEVVLLKDGRRMTFRPKIQVCRESKELRWLGCFILAALFAGDHFFELEASHNGRETKFIHGEIFTGLVPEYFQHTEFYDMLESHYHQMNRDLRDEVLKRGFADIPDDAPQTGTRLGAILR